MLYTLWGGKILDKHLAWRTSRVKTVQSARLRLYDCTDSADSQGQLTNLETTWPYLNHQQLVFDQDKNKAHAKYKSGTTLIQEHTNDNWNRFKIM